LIWEGSIGAGGEDSDLERGVEFRKTLRGKKAKKIWEKNPQNQRTEDTYGAEKRVRDQVLKDQGFQSRKVCKKKKTILKKTLCSLPIAKARGRYITGKTVSSTLLTVG